MAEANPFARRGRSSKREIEEVVGVARGGVAQGHGKIKLVQ